MFDTLPQDYEVFLQWEWGRIEPYANDLTHRELTAETIDEWFADWSQLASLVIESFYRLQVRTTTHTNDEEGLARFLNYSKNIMPKVRTFEQTMKEILLASGLEPADFSIPLIYRCKPKLNV